MPYAYLSRLLVLLGFLLIPISLTAQTSEKADSIIAIYDSISDMNDRAIAICKSAQRMIGEDMNLSIELTQFAIENAKQYNAIKGLRIGYMTLGGIYYFKGDYDIAVAQFYKAIELPESEGNLNSKDARVLGNIGIIYKKQGNLPKALEVQSKALNIFESKNDSMGTSITFTNIGEIYRIQKEYDSAIFYFGKSENIKLSLGHQSGLAIVYNNMGLCYSEKGAFEKGAFYLNKSYNIEKKIGNQVRITETLLDLANHYFLSHQYQESIKNANLALVSSKALELKRNTSDLYLILSQNYEALNKYKKAHSYHKLYSEQREKILNEDINEKIAEMDVKYETVEKEKEITHKTAEIEKNKLQRNAFAIVFILSLVIVYFLFRANKRNKQIADLMKGHNLLIEKKNAALNTINDNVNTELGKLQLALEDKESILSKIFESKKKNELPPELLALSKREMEVLSYLALGWQDQEISDKLFISKSTTKTHLRRIYSKLMVRGRTEAVAIAHRHELIGSL